MAHSIRYRAERSPALIIFDSVAGGAGHAQRIAERLDEVVRAALERVSNCPNCSEDTSCYTCLRSYRNQRSHELLSRGAAAEVLRGIVVVDEDAALERELDMVEEQHRPLVRRMLQFGAPPPEYGWEMDDGTVLEVAWPNAKVGVLTEGQVPPEVDDWLIGEPANLDLERAAERIRSTT